jgi:hypothetical protein
MYPRRHTPTVIIKNQVVVCEPITTFEGDTRAAYLTTRGAYAEKLEGLVRQHISRKDPTVAKDWDKEFGGILAYLRSEQGEQLCGNPLNIIHVMIG